MQQYRARIRYSEDSITRLCKVQSKVYFSPGRALLLLICVSLMSAGVIWKGANLVKIILVAAGALSYSFISYVPVYKAKATLSTMKGNYPETTYTFSDSCILLESGTKNAELEYEKIIGIAHDESYIYMFISKTRAYMIDKNRIRPMDPDGLIKFLTDKINKKARYIGTSRRKKIGLTNNFGLGRRER